jgi:hypothetical protein
VSPAVLSLVALLLAIVVSMASRLNVGVLAMTFAWLIGVSARWSGWRTARSAWRAAMRASFHSSSSRSRWASRPSARDPSPRSR